MNTKLLFKHSKPIIRPFKFIKEGDLGDMPYLWDAYKKDLIEDLPKDISMEDFVGAIDEAQDIIQEMWTLEDKVKGTVKPIGVVTCKNDGWQLEPSVQYYDTATPRTVLRSYIAFLKKTKYRKDIGACVVKAEKKGINLANKAQKLGLLEYVGKVWGGRPSGNEYVYSVRCGRRQ